MWKQVTIWLREVEKQNFDNESIIVREGTEDQTDRMIIEEQTPASGRAIRKGGLVIPS